MADNARILELLAAKKRAQEELEREIAQLTAQLEGGDKLLPRQDTPPSSPEVVLSPTRSSTQNRAPHAVVSDDEDDGPQMGRFQRLSSFGRLSMSSLPEHCHLNKSDIQLLGQVGRGSFGVVWRAKYKERSEVAVKLFLYEDVESEIIMLASIAPHPHVLNFLGVIFEVDDPYKEPQVRNRIYSQH
jgi:hypothetical protein